jgi:ATP-binding cassette subfamily C protein
VLSAGERQLLTLVRSCISPARLVILDEATCHLDPQTEARVEPAFAARDGRLIVIAHRIGSVLRADRVLVLHAGQALVGSHDELLLCSALYRDLVVTGARRRPPWAAGRGRRAAEPRAPIDLFSVN